MAIVPNPHKTTGVLGWIDDRFPLTKMWKDHISEYYAPKNFNFWYFFGSLAMVVLVNQLLTGIFLTMATSFATCTPLAHRLSSWSCFCTCTGH